MAKQSINNDHAASVAQAIMHEFIPKDQAATAFDFHFTLPQNNHYRAAFAKDNAGKWVLTGLETAEKP